MSATTRKSSSKKMLVRARRKVRIRGRVAGSTERPRLVVFKSNSNIYAQVIDDSKGVTLVSASTLDKELAGKTSGNKEGAKKVGELIGKRATAQSISKVVFDRSGYLYHGKIKELADAARAAGLDF